MKVRRIAHTSSNFSELDDVPWTADEENFDYYDYSSLTQLYDGQALAEFAGRACYQSWKRPNPSTASNESYLANIIRTGHFSVLEHASVTFYLTGVSRSFTHELVRHRHLSYSQLSQRYVDESDTEFVPPPLIKGDLGLEHAFDIYMDDAKASYNAFVENLEMEFPDKARKEIRQAARAVLPNATETKIVVTGNYRAWWEFLLLRATVHADVEIRAVAVAILRELQLVAPFVFNHFVISALDDGSEIATLKAD